MAFIVKKKIHGKEYFYLNENKRVPSSDGGTKVKTKTIAYLGKIKKDAEKKAKEIIKSIKADKELMEIKKEKNAKEQHEKKELSIEELTAFCKRKGFIFRSSDIYGGF